MVHATVPRRLYDLLGSRGRLADTEPCIQTVDCGLAGFGLPFFKHRIGTPMEFLARENIRIPQQAVRVDFFPSGDLPKMPLDLGMGSNDDRRRAAFDQRLD